MKMRMQIDLFFNRKLSGEEVGELLKEIDEMVAKKFKEDYDGFGIYTERELDEKEIEDFWKRIMGG